MTNSLKKSHFIIRDVRGVSMGSMAEDEVSVFPEKYICKTLSGFLQYLGWETNKLPKCPTCETKSQGETKMVKQHYITNSEDY